MRSRLIPLIAALSLIAAACGDDTATSDPAPSTTTSTSPSATTTESASDDPPPRAADVDPLVDIVWMENHDHVLVDARTAENYEAGHIGGARSLSAGVLNDASSAVPYQLGSAEHVGGVLSELGVTEEDTIVLYDDDGSLYAARVYWALTYYGHGHLRILDGGLGAFEDAGGSLEVGAGSDAIATDYVVTGEQAELRLELADVTEALGVASFADARSPSEFDGTVELTEFSGHIPGAGNVDYVQTIDADGYFLPADELAALYEDAGLLPGDDVVTYCLVGARAAHAWFVLSELLDYPSVALYDGSWQEYGNTPGADVES